MKKIIGTLGVVLSALLLGAPAAIADDEKPPPPPPPPVEVPVTVEVPAPVIKIDQPKDKTSATIKVEFPGENLDPKTKLCVLNDGAPILYDGPISVKTVGQHTVTCRVKDVDGNKSPESIQSFEVCKKHKPQPPKPDVNVKFWGSNCTADGPAWVWMMLEVRGRDTVTIKYTTTTGLDGELSAGGNPWRYDKDGRKLVFLEDEGDGLVTVQFGKREKTLDTDCEKPTVPTEPTEPTVPTIPTVPTVPTEPTAPGVSYENCDDVRAAGAAPIRFGDPGWRPGFDADQDGLGCESYESTPYQPVNNAKSSDSGDLAYTGTSGVEQLLVAGGVLVVLGGGAFIVLRLRTRGERRGQSGVHRL